MEISLWSQGGRAERQPLGTPGAALNQATSALKDPFSALANLDEEKQGSSRVSPAPIAFLIHREPGTYSSLAVVQSSIPDQTGGTMQNGGRNCENPGQAMKQGFTTEKKARTHTMWTLEESQKEDWK
ncbi:hypothetical protein R1sor_015246 [Riccia sorocarpa]|uniref:Uncharacterized protein n=1 Tax=Riccia sorocarpa TaxID=122646 RepID=A0ABD3HBR5_9MARC